MNLPMQVKTMLEVLSAIFRTHGFFPNNFALLTGCVQEVNCYIASLNKSEKIPTSDFINRVVKVRL